MCANGHGRARPGYPYNKALCLPNRDSRDKPAYDSSKFLKTALDRRLLAVGFQPRVDQRLLGVDRRKA